MLLHLSERGNCTDCSYISDLFNMNYIAMEYNAAIIRSAKLFIVVVVQMWKPVFYILVGSMTDFLEILVPSLHNFPKITLLHISLCMWYRSRHVYSLFIVVGYEQMTMSKLL